MSKILLDGEGIYAAAQVVRRIKDKELNISDYDALLNVIVAIVLWDDVYIFSERFSSWYVEGIDYFNQYCNNFHILDTTTRLDMPNDLRKMLLDHFFERYEDPRTGVSSYRVSFQDKRALEYLFTANINGLDYMPSIERQMILERYNYTSFFLRKDVISKVDKELERYYKQANQSISVKRIKYVFPVLLDYLLERYDIEDIIKGAFELKQNRSLVKFRKSMDLLDKAWESGNIKYIDDYFKEIERIIGVLSGTIKCDKKFGFTASIPLALSVDMAVPLKRPFHLVFLKDLAFYGIKNRPSKLNSNSKIPF